MINNTKPIHTRYRVTRSYMAEMGLNQARMVQKCGRSHRKINKVINGRCGISSQFAIVLATVMPVFIFIARNMVLAVIAVVKPFANFGDIKALGLTDAIHDYCHNVFNYFRNESGLNVHRSNGYLSKSYCRQASL